MPDMAGEAVLQEVDHPHTYRVISAYLKKCMGALVLIDTTKLKEGSLEHDYFTMKLVSYLGELGDDSHGGWSRKPVALVFTKADQCDECQADPTAYAKAHATGLWQQCQERFRLHQFFAVSVAGNCVYRYTPQEGRICAPLRVEPHGIVEPFAWLLSHIK